MRGGGGNGVLARLVPFLEGSQCRHQGAQSRAARMKHMRGRGEGDTNEYYARRRTTFPAWNGDDGYVEDEVAPFGYSLTLDLYRCDPKMIASISCVYEYLEGL